MALDNFWENGFAIVPVLSEEEVENILSIVVKLIRSVVEIPESELDKGSLWLINKYLPIVYENPKNGSLIYDSMNLNTKFKNIFSEKVLIDALNEIFSQTHCDVELLFGDLQFFFHLPNIDRETLGWHQDTAYFKHNYGREKSVVVWIPLLDCMSEDGAVWIIPGSHKNGYIEHHTNVKGEHKDKEWNKRGMVYLPENVIDEEKAVQVELKKGEALVFDMNLFHKSGLTRGDNVRVTCVSRFGNFYDEDFQNKYK